MWSEPTRSLRLRWGSYLPRYLVGLAAIVVGVAATNLTSTYSLWFLLIGPVVQAVGWLCLPAALWRRLLVLVPCMIAGLVPVAGPDFVGAFAALLAAWLLVRHRPAVSYLAVVAPIAASIVAKLTLHEYTATAVALFFCAGVSVAAAWFARQLARWRDDRRAVTRTTSQP
ncbi:hypothetical protein GCM10022381_00050 [Leifsonia kafniensis]|uniref:Uncharacterized protein n=1 Tax=Leifsonia kafniensis TaxID=475957 RepID=A0ABP7JY33_9MICO